MCGRTVCALAPECVQQACSYRSKSSKSYKQPEWKESGSTSTYKPSYNVCPTDVTPVIVAGTHFDSEEERVLVPMVWGMIPPWHKGSAKGHGLTTHNCRLEGVESSKLYKPSLTSGRRCVVYCDGFYEWQTTKGDKNKQPFFIYTKQADGVNAADPAPGTWSEESGWSGMTPLLIAGIFNTFTDAQGEVIYSYAMVTMESNSHFSWLHHRMPAVLDSEDQVAAWLDNTTVNATDALARLKPVDTLAWHAVGKAVGNSRNKDSQCNKPVDSSPAKAPAVVTPMMKWLKMGTPVKKSPPSSPTKRSSDEVDSPMLENPSKKTFGVSRNLNKKK